MKTHLNSDGKIIGYSYDSSDYTPKDRPIKDFDFTCPGFNLLVWGDIAYTIIIPAYFLLSEFNFTKCITSLVGMIIVSIVTIGISLFFSQQEYTFSQTPFAFLLYHLSWFAFAFALWTLRFSLPLGKSCGLGILYLGAFCAIQCLCIFFAKKKKKQRH